MNYESEEHYQAEIGAAGQAESDAGYHEYLDSLLDAKEFELWAYVTRADILSRKFPEAAAYLQKLRDEYLEARRKHEEKHTATLAKMNEPSDDLPF